MNLLLIISTGGLGKSRAVRDALEGNDVCWIEGNATPLGVYIELYRHRDEPTVLDDVDSLYSERNGTRLLKSLCQTERIKRVAWHSTVSALRVEKIPRQFSTMSRVIIISNDWRTVNRNVEAVQDRGHLIVFEPTPEEVHAHVQRWFDDNEILSWFEKKLPTIGRPSIRHYLRAAELKRAGLNWMRVLTEGDTEHRRARIVRELANDPQYSREEERVAVFRKRRGGCRSTYFNWKRRLGLVSFPIEDDAESQKKLF